MLAAITTELLIVIKFGKGMFPKPFPPHVIVGWALFAIFLILFAIYKFVLVDTLNSKQTPHLPKSVSYSAPTKERSKSKIHKTLSLQSDVLGSEDSETRNLRKRTKKSYKE
eukprot:NODE_35_length_36362_cov_0.944434.p32 type:complete len:111 gc:universal NODE_35_length_36362_cov_0.944434:26783-26451(-)